MKRLAFSILSFICCACIIFAGTAPSLAVDETESLIDGIVDFKLKESGNSSVSELAKNGLSSGAGKGSAEWYAIGLSAYYGGLDLSGYGSALSSYLSKSTISSPVSRQRCALALIACKMPNDPFVSATAKDSVGSLGIMSYIFGLELSNNGAAVSVSKDDIISELLSLKNSDGGWSVSGGNSDVDVTAMALTALAPHKGEQRVSSAVNDGLSLLSSRQLSSGGFSSYGTENAESSAQVIVALTALSINPKTDSRFLKNGNSVFSALSKFRLSDGSFCHAMGGSSNGTATVQVFYSLVALWRYEHGLPSLFNLSVNGTKAVPAKSPVADPSGNNNGSGSNTGDKNNNHNNGHNGSTGNQGGQNGQGTANGQNDAGSPNQTDQSPSPDGQDTPADGSADQTAEKDGRSEGLVTADGSSLSADSDRSNGGKAGFFSSYKPVAIGVILILAAAAALILFLKKKLNKKNAVFLAISAAVLSLAVLLTSFQTAGNYYSPVSKPDSVGKASISIRCDTVLGKSESSHIPQDGIILDTTELDITENQTVYDLLTDAAKTYNIQVENSGVNGQNISMAYIRGINYIYEFDFGDLSGWMYKVNGQTPSVGCGEYVLSPGDKVEWLYTCDLGKDIE